MTPIDSRKSERHLLAEMLGWARDNGWRPIWAGKRRDGLWTWTSAPRRPKRPSATARRLTFDGRHLQVTAYTEGVGWRALATVEVSSITQAVDVLVALGILPAWLSSSWAAAEDRYAERNETQAEELDRQRRRAAFAEREHERVLRRLEEAEQKARDADKRLWAARMVTCWTNEDGKRFVFADDLLAAIDPDLAAKVGLGESS